MRPIRFWRLVITPRAVLGEFVPGVPAQRCIVDRPRYITNWTAKYGKKLRQRVMQPVRDTARLSRKRPITLDQLRGRLPGARVVALPSVPPGRINQLREQLSTSAQPLATSIRHTHKGALYAALEIER